MGDAEQRISVAAAAYALDTAAQRPHAGIPLASAGIMNTRLPDAPVGAAVEVESQLHNMYDLIGRGGVLSSEAAAALRRLPPPPPAPAPAAARSAAERFDQVDALLQGASDREPRACHERRSFYRLDPNPPPPTPVSSRATSERTGELTRATAKDAYASSCGRP